jgi:hypothetical protein
MIDRTFIADWRHMRIPLLLTIIVIGGALFFAFGWSGA